MTQPPIRFYGRRRGKPIRSIRGQMMTDWLPYFVPKVPSCGYMELSFGIRPKALYLEVGFGGGEHLATLAKKYPHNAFFGAEPFLNGVASLLAHLNGSHHSGQGSLALESDRVDNVRIWPDDVRLLFDKLPDESFDGIFVLYPDPWSKKRHATRRFINDENIPQLYRLLKPKGKIYLATDVAPYVDWALERMRLSGLFTQTKRAIHTPPKDWVPTRYELKGIAAGRQPNYLIFQKKCKKMKKST